MDKKLFFEDLSYSLEDQVKAYEPNATVKYDLNLSSIYVVFPPKREFISYYVLEVIRKAGGEISVGYYGNHMEVTVHVLYCE